MAHQTHQTENDVATEPQQTNATSLEVENYKIIWNNTQEIMMGGDGEPERKEYNQDGKEPKNIGAKTSSWNGLKAFGCAGVAGLSAAQTVAAAYTAFQAAVFGGSTTAAVSSIIVQLDAIAYSIACSSSAGLSVLLGMSDLIGGAASATGLYSYGALAGATGGFGLIGLAAIGGIGHYAYKAYKGYKDGPAREEFNRLAKEYNKKVLEYEEKKKSFEEVAKKIKECFLELKEHELLRYALAIKELFDGNDTRRIIIAIGPTGSGKSLVCNRLFGDDAEIKVIRRDENRLFKVGKFGQATSETSSMKMISSDIKMAAGKENKEFKLYVTDTPGAADSKGKDDLHDKQMLNFCEISDGVHAFLLFFKFNNKVDNNYKTLLKKYNRLWGDMFWQYCIIVVTHCERNITKGWNDDDEKEFQDGIKSTERAITDALNEVSGNRFGETCKERIITFGEEDKEWKPSVLKLFLKLYDDYEILYKPKKKQTPLHKLLYQQKEEAKNLKRVLEELQDLKEKVSEQEKILQN